MLFTLPTFLLLGFLVYAFYLQDMSLAVRHLNETMTLIFGKDFKGLNSLLNSAITSSFYFVESLNLKEKAAFVYESAKTFSILAREKVASTVNEQFNKAFESVASKSLKTQKSQKAQKK